MTTTDHEAIGNNPRTERRKPNRRTRRRRFRAHGAKLEAAGSHVLQPDRALGNFSSQRRVHVALLRSAANNDSCGHVHRYHSQPEVAASGSLT